MKLGHARSEQVHLVTQARRPMSEDIRYRQSRYLIMMGIRVICFVIAIILYIAHMRWLKIVPAIGAIFIPYFAVVFANGGREPDNIRGFVEYHTSLPPQRDRRSDKPSDDGQCPFPRFRARLSAPSPRPRGPRRRLGRALA